MAALEPCLIDANPAIEGHGNPTQTLEPADHGRVLLSPGPELDKCIPHGLAGGDVLLDTILQTQRTTTRVSRFPDVLGEFRKVGQVGRYDGSGRVNEPERLAQIFRRHADQLAVKLATGLVQVLVRGVCR